MAEKTLNTRQKQKYDTSINWTSNNPVLLAGEIGIESDTNKFKIGNGTSAWNELDYVGSGEVVLYSTTGQNTDGAMTQNAVTVALNGKANALRWITDVNSITESGFYYGFNVTNSPVQGSITITAQVFNEQNMFFIVNLSSEQEVWLGTKRIDVLTWWKGGKTTVNIDNVTQTTLSFDSDPQTQITQNTQDIEDLQNITNTKVQEISLTGTTGGTITAEQLTTLQADDSNYIILNDEIYRLADKQDASGYRVYMHTGQVTKSLRIAITTLAWTLVSIVIVDTSTNQIIGGKKNFTGIFQINGGTITYNASSDTFTI